MLPERIVRQRIVSAAMMVCLYNVVPGFVVVPVYMVVRVFVVVPVGNSGPLILSGVFLFPVQDSVDDRVDVLFLFVWVHGEVRVASEHG